MAMVGDARIVVRQDAGACTLVPSGDWTLATAPALEGEVSRIAPPGGGNVVIDLSGIGRIDSTGAWLLFRLRKRLRAEGHACDFTGVQENHKGLFEHVFASREQPELEHRSFRPFHRLADHTGYQAVQTWKEAQALLSFFGELMVTAARTLVRPKRVKITPMVHHMEQVGLNALPIIGLLSFLIGVVLTFQGADQLRRFGAEIFTVNLLGIAFLRETGILMAAIIVAGRSGSAFAAQIGTMKVNEEVDAMRALGLNPMELLVLPRMFALVLVMPLIGFYADMAGLLGGALMATISLNLSIGQFLTQLQNAVPMWAFWVGIIKAPVFAFIIAMVGCYNGLKVTGSAESVGKMTTRAVVQSIFLVIVVDAAFSVLFSFIGI